MAVPKKKSSPMTQGHRWSHIHAAVGVVSSCSHCQKPARPHHMCRHCGHYKGRKVLVTRKEKRQMKANSADSE